MLFSLSANHWLRSVVAGFIAATFFMTATSAQTSNEKRVTQVLFQVMEFYIEKPMGGFEGLTDLIATAEEEDILSSPTYGVRIETYTALSDDTVADQALTYERAMLLQRKLIELGVPADKIDIHSFGSSRPTMEDLNGVVFEEIAEIFVYDEVLINADNEIVR